MSTIATESAASIYGSFFIDQAEFALHVTGIQEVVNLPARLVRVPLAPDFLLGMFNLRGLMIPIVNLRRLLGFADAETPPSAKVAIVSHDGIRVGLLFDSTGEILRVRPDEKSDFVYQEGSAPRVVGGAIKLNQGERLLQLIDPWALVSIANIPHVLEHQKLQEKARQSERQKCISFTSAGVRMAIEIGGIYEILRVPEIQHSALTGRRCLGVINVRGQVIPVINFATLMGQPDAEGLDVSERRIVVLKLDQEFFGLRVDSVDSISAYRPEDIMPIPLLAPERAEMFRGCVELGDEREVILIDHQRILSNEEVIEITQGHSRIYQAKAVAGTKAKRGVDRHVYISFRLDKLFGVSIGDVKEIIDNPREMIRAPGLPFFVRGILNLRGELVTVADARLLYKLEAAHPPDPKVLIFQIGTENFGLVVDSVESILTVHEDQKLTLSKAMCLATSDAYENDIKEALEFTADSGEKTSLIVLNVAPLATRIRQGARAA